MEGEHYITTNLLNLLPGSSSPSREQKTEVVGRELVIFALLGQPSFASEDTGPAPQASWQGEGGNHLKRLPLARKGSCPAPRALKRKKGTPRKKKVP